MLMKVSIAFQPADECWGKGAIISFQQNSAIIHLDNENDLQKAQKAARKLRTQGIKAVELSGDNWSANLCWFFYQGFHSAKQDYSIEFPTLTNEQENEQLLAWINCSDFVKTLINSPSTEITPLTLAQSAADFIREQASTYCELGESAVSFEIISGEALKEKQYEGIWQVGKSSINPPAFLQLDFNPTGSQDTPVFACLVGKGITFDTGGYSLKPSNFMETMRADMGGAALISGALALAITQGLKKRVKLYLCCAENMISRDAMKLGDIITYRNGVTAEVLNTDAEGRLVLADGLIDASAQNPQMLIDCATLTGAAKIAVGNDYHSVLSQDDQLTEKLLNSAKQQNEPFWRLPFADFHRPQISSTYADIANTSTVAVSAGASTATAFLSHFVTNHQKNWLHIDCSATFCKSANSLWAAGATGLGVKTLANLLCTENQKEA